MHVHPSVALALAGLLIAPIALAAGFGVGRPDKTTDVSGNSGKNMTIAQTDGATSNMGWFAMRDCLAVLRNEKPAYPVG